MTPSNAKSVLQVPAFGGGDPIPQELSQYAKPLVAYVEGNYPIGAPMPAGLNDGLAVNPVGSYVGVGSAADNARAVTYPPAVAASAKLPAGLSSTALLMIAAAAFFYFTKKKKA